MLTRIDEEVLQLLRSQYNSDHWEQMGLDGYLFDEEHEGYIVSRLEAPLLRLGGLHYAILWEGKLINVEAKSSLLPTGKPLLENGHRTIKVTSIATNKIPKKTDNIFSSVKYYFEKPRNKREIIAIVTRAIEALSDLQPNLEPIKADMQTDVYFVNDVTRSFKSLTTDKW